MFTNRAGGDKEKKHGKHDSIKKKHSFRKKMSTSPLKMKIETLQKRLTHMELFKQTYDLSDEQIFSLYTSWYRLKQELELQLSKVEAQ